MHEVVLKRFERPDEVRVFEKGEFELVHSLERPGSCADR
jgi:hypothetical protein